MRKRCVWLAALVLCLGLLPGCGSVDKRVYGEVTEWFGDDGGKLIAFVVETDSGKELGFRLTEESIVWPMEDFTGERFAVEGPAGVIVSVSYQGRAEALTRESGEKIRTYNACSVHVDELLTLNAAALSDGTPIHMWKGFWDTNRYALEDGTELLREQMPHGPADSYVIGLESMGDLSETAKKSFLAFYEKQGLLYDVPAELERAYADYLACGDKGKFDFYTVGQEVSPCASSRRVMYFLTTVILPVSGSECTEVRQCAAFDRQTGECIPAWDLFTCGPEEVKGAVLDASAFLEDDPGLRAEMEAAFAPEHIIVCQEDLSVDFPAGTLPSQEHSYGLGLDYGEIPGLLHDWALPRAGK